MQFRKKPVVIDAIQLPAVCSGDMYAVKEWCEEHEFGEMIFGPGRTLEIATLEGTMTAQPLDWIIKGVNGEFYPCKPDIFDKTYEPVE